jgi:hypothetical protein
VIGEWKRESAASAAGKSNLAQVSFMPREMERFYISARLNVKITSLWDE